MQSLFSTVFQPWKWTENLQRLQTTIRGKLAAMQRACLTCRASAGSGESLCV